jgi:hypothetical protein
MTGPTRLARFGASLTNMSLVCMQASLLGLFPREVPAQLASEVVTSLIGVKLVLVSALATAWRHRR